MTKARTIRWITLTSFCLLLTAFILYRTGRLDKYLYNSSQLEKASNTLPAQDSLGMIVVNGYYANPIELLSSSKSIKLIEDHTRIMPYFVDTLPGSVYGSVDSALRDLKLFSDADTAVIMNPRSEWHNLVRIDITYRDSAKLKRYFDSVKKTIRDQ
ncbi:MAG TPA: hypothetical protein VFZ47_05200 [Chitinophagaceae bacterium]